MAVGGIAARLGLRGGQTAGRSLLTRFSGSQATQGIRSVVQTLTANPLRALGTGTVTGAVLSDIPVVGDMIPGGSSEDSALVAGAVVLAAVVGGAIVLR